MGRPLGEVTFYVVSCQSGLESADLRIAGYRRTSGTHLTIVPILLTLHASAGATLFRYRARLPEGLYSASAQIPRHCASPSNEFFSVVAKRTRDILLGTTRRFFTLPPPLLSSFVVELPFHFLTTRLESTRSDLRLTGRGAYGVADGTAVYFDGLRPGSYRLWISDPQFRFCYVVSLPALLGVYVLRLSPSDIQHGFSEYDSGKTSCVRRNADLPVAAF